MTATNGTPELGAVAASYAGVRISFLFAGDRRAAAPDYEILCDVRNHQQYVTRTPRSASCRFHHRVFELGAITSETLASLGEIVGGGAALGVPFDEIVGSLGCNACGARHPVARARRRLDAAALRCPSCGEPRRVAGFDLMAQLPLGAFEPEDLGLRAGDVVELCDPHSDRVGHVLLTEDGVLPTDRLRSAVLCGLGNIGSPLAGLLGRIPGIQRIDLCDPDSYEVGQHWNQQIEPADEGREKAVVQAERLRRLRPDLRIEAHVCPLEDLPLGLFRGAVAISALDSFAARLALAERCWVMGAPLLDAAVEPGQHLARTNVYVAGPDTSCAHCAMDDESYRAAAAVAACAEARREQTWT